MATLSLSETINALRAKGYVEDFNLKKTFDEATHDHIENFAKEFVIDQIFRFDVQTDPGDQSVLYAIHSNKTGEKGLLVNGYGIYSDTLTNAKIEALDRAATPGGVMIFPKQ